MPGLLMTPRWLVLHATVIALVLGFVALGWWQLDVYRDSDTRHAIRAAAPVELGTVTEPGVPLGDAADRHVQAHGTYRHDLIVPARVHDGVLGAYAVGILETTDGFVTVLRGWRHDPADFAPAGGTEVSVRGHLIPAELPGYATGGSQLTDGMVRYLAPDQVATATDTDPSALYDGYLVLTEESPQQAEPPVALDVDRIAPVRDVNPWQNLSYWAQWWVFAGAVVVFWISTMRTAVKKRSMRARDARTGPEPRPFAQR